ncbi:MAG: RDD family protein [Bryobacteraceae bacterium]
MTCQHCQTWVLDEDHRCHRCGRRVKTTATRISPQTYPIAATATAPAYDNDVQPVESSGETVLVADPAPHDVQQPLFSAPSCDPRVIPFDSLNTQAARESIRARAAGLVRPAPLKAERVQVRHAGARRRRPANQRDLELFGQSEVPTQPQSSIICDAPVAPTSLRMEAGIIDGLLMAAGAGSGVAIFRYFDGQISLEKHSLFFLALALITIPFFYKLLWTFAGLDTIGMRKAGLRLVDFDGNPPSHERRYQRLLGSMISALAGGLGLIWVFLDQDCLTWHDHISSTFPTISSEM